jgi:acyl-coenzyme A thioesterase PaaI-like protein
MTTPIADNYCFVCGRDNPRGLKIAVTYREAEMAAETELALPREFQGWAGVIHGGILATLLDEMMAHAVWHFAGPGLTLGLEVRFHAPLKPDEPILVRGVLHTQTGSRRLAEGEIIRLADGVRIASGKSRFLLWKKIRAGLPPVPLFLARKSGSDDYFAGFMSTGFRSWPQTHLPGFWLMVPQLHDGPQAHMYLPWGLTPRAFSQPSACT